MRVLLDESLPRQLVGELVGHDVHTVASLGWAGLDNGELLRRARREGFPVLVTADQNIQYQQNVPASGVSIIVFEALTNRMEDLLPLVPSLLEAIPAIQPGEVVRISA